MNDRDWDRLDEIPYRKQSARKAPPKLDHKHDWEQVMTYNTEEGAHLRAFNSRKYHYRLTSRCRLCARVLPGGPLYAKEGENYYPVSYGAEPIRNLRDRYDCYAIDKPAARPNKDATYSLIFKRKELL